MNDEKKVLVCFGERKRIVCIPSNSSDEPSNVKEQLHANACEIYKDVIPAGIESIFFQVKDEDWGEFLDLTEGQSINHRSIVNMIVVNSKQVQYDHTIRIKLSEVYINAYLAH